MIELIVFIIQIIVIVVVILYVYFTFRHNVTIPTADEYIAQISPGLTQLTDKQSEVVFWFYSLSEKRYLKFTLDQDMKTTIDVSAKTHERVNHPANRYYFNFVRQRWERMIALEEKPKMRERDSIEQNYELCYIDNINGDAEPICEQIRHQTFMKLNIHGERYRWTGKQIQQDTKSVFPTDVDVCKFTMNRYRELMNIYYDYRDEKANTEINFGVYFMKEDGQWKLYECQHPNHMFFNGKTCVYKYNRLPSDSNAINEYHKQIKEEDIPHTINYPDTEHINYEDIYSYHLHLNASHTMHINMNVNEKLFLVNTDFYATCYRSIFVAGEPKFENMSRDEDMNGMNFKWSIEQIIVSQAIEEMKSEYLNFLPLLERPLKMFYIATGEILTVDKPFVIYRNSVFYMHDYLFEIYNKLMEANYEHPNGIDISIEPMHDVSHQTILPHTRLYRVDDYVVYAIFSGETIFDMYIETKLLADYLQDIEKYDFYNRNTYPVITDDFKVDTWSCVSQNVDKPEKFTYISLVDMFNGLVQHATATRKLPQSSF
ncbi:hypothetical protein [Drosophila suzukii associated hytrosavirus 1]|nr:hypothetical protein [Drosophila suzukii associated hytrosavirus 1]